MMWRNRMTKKMLAILSLVAMLMVLGISGESLTASNQKPLHYDVSVIVKVIPVFAVDAVGTFFV